MNINPILDIIISFLFLRYFIIPLVFGVLCFIVFFNSKNEIKKAGKIYHKEDRKESGNFKRFVKICLISMPVVFIITIISRRWLMSMIFCGLFFIYIAAYLNDKYYGNASGIYENGVIDHKYFDFISLTKWNEIHSYKITNENIFGCFNSGQIFEFKHINNIFEIKELFKKNRITERE